MSAHRFDPTILREYDIRGVVGKTLHEADARAIGRAFSALVAEKGGKRVAIGYDGRLSSPTMENALVEGFTSCGIDVVRVGLGPTPMLYFAATTLDVDGGIMITGSHNPPDYNGFKMVKAGKPFFGAAIQTIGTMAEAGDVVPEGVGRVADVAIAADYVARILRDWDGGERALGQDIVVPLLDGAGARGQFGPFDIQARGLEHALGGAGDFRADAVSGDQCDGVSGHGRVPFVAVQGSTRLYETCRN